MRASHCTAGVPDLCHKTPQTGPYPETPREREASRSPRTRSPGHTRCLRSCWGTRRLGRELRLAESRGTNGLGAPPPLGLRSRGRLRRGVGRGVNLSLAELKALHCGGPRPPLSTQTQGALPGSRAGSEGQGRLQQARQNPRSTGTQTNKHPRGVGVASPGSGKRGGLEQRRRQRPRHLPVPALRASHLLCRARARSPGGGGSLAPGNAAGGSCAPSCS